MDANYEVAVYTSVRFALSHVPASVWAVVCGIGSVLCLTQAWLLRQYATALEELPILSAREAAHQVWSAWKTRYTVLIHEYCQSRDADTRVLSGRDVDVHCLRNVDGTSNDLIISQRVGLRE